MERQFGAHVTADTEEQWVKGVLPVGAKFNVANVVDLQKLLPDCGYQLRSVELEATGRLASIECDDCDSGEATVLNVTGGGTQLELADLDDPVDGEVHLVGVVMPPFDGHLQVDVQELTSK